MAGVPPIDFEVEDFKDPQKLQAFREHYQLMVQELNRLAGVFGPVQLPSGMDLKGGSIVNVGTPADPKISPTAAVSQATAIATVGPAATQKALEATGSTILQTTRRLNDTQQREQFSSFLNQQLSIPPCSNNSSINVVDNGNGTSTVTVTASFCKLSDQSVIPYAQRSDTFTNPVSGSNFYFYYLRGSDKTLQFIGPFTTNTSFNQMPTNFDGREFIGTAQVNAAGGGSGSGGGQHGGGCLELGTPLSFPVGRKWNLVVEPCDDWINIIFEDGRTIKAARDTRISLWKKVQDLDSSDVADSDGGFVRVIAVNEVKESGFKMKVTVEGGRYLGKGISFHNSKIISPP
jgi:hypothetical protein